MRWMKLEPIIQSEVSQKDEDHYSILLIFLIVVWVGVTIILFLQMRNLIHQEAS